MFLLFHCLQTAEILVLRKWIIEIGLPSNKRQNTLQTELINVIEDKSRTDMELKLIFDEKNDLQHDQETITKSYSMLKENYVYSIQQNTDLKSINDEYKTLNDKLQSRLDRINRDLLTEQQHSKQYEDIIENLTKLNEQYKKANNQLLIKTDQQNKQITSLSNMNAQIEIAV